VNAPGRLGMISSQFPFLVDLGKRATEGQPQIWSHSDGEKKNSRDFAVSPQIDWWLKFLSNSQSSQANLATI
jgi:methionine aminopeptidase